MKFSPLSSLLAFGLVLLSMVVAVPVADVSNDSSNVTVSIQDLHARQGTAIDALRDVEPWSHEFANKGRETFTRGMISKLREANPFYNYVIFRPNPKHKVDFFGEEGFDWQRTAVTYYDDGLTYSLVAGKAGTFTRAGDGGHLNWAFGGHIISYEKNTVEFGP